ncbi:MULTISPECIES: twin-arginine translocase TatA/TatE family subunit [Legionella]|uniref:Sec-independent protein translocase protein TatA n=1 Tax=Legionella steelei TaxID=947033 RepID=A0A0W0ZK67_9GAMM|nr:MULTISPECIES: twin-arginine translocase TatA/TatE family subunit [Legionella]KTD69563.1 TatA protein(twin arginine translocation) [Legionella steelei]MBN9227114.1 twin-arginine translocase TatA/TatE family subunit [Legionella steelei]OJW07322.1 MAG: Sec-independent protein translocase TatA [Legionella sp. 39-23]
MGLSGISPLSLLLILVIIIALFGTSKLKTIGTDLGEAIRNFRKALNEEQSNEPAKEDNKLS